MDDLHVENGTVWLEDVCQLRFCGLGSQVGQVQVVASVGLAGRVRARHFIIGEWLARTVGEGVAGTGIEG